MKLKSVYICEKCGHQENKWTGKCSGCDAWNSFVEDVIDTSPRKHAPVQAKKSEKLTHSKAFENRLETGIGELDRALGGGIVEGNFILLSGEPGIGKSTLTMQLCGKIAGQKKVLYVSGEESVSQVASRAHRLGVKSENISILSDTNIESVLGTIEDEKPEFVIVDSIQVVSSVDIPSLAGSVNQVRACAEKLMEVAKNKKIPVVITGHVTKDGNLAGPKMLEHLVDTVLYLEGDRYQNFRLLRSIKNRFGSTNEVGVFEMKSDGLKEVENPSKIFLEGREPNAIGSVVTTTIEGSRPFLIEVQALTDKTAFGYPKRAAQGYDLQRTHLMLAVLQKYLKMNFLEKDVYVNVAGGMKLKDPACDLGILMAIASSFKHKHFPTDTLILGEVGLSGEIRSVTKLEQRLKEAEKLGMKQAVIPRTSEKLSTKLKLIQVSNIREALSIF
ncbi:MAG: DNA repair protein RadA [Patescibacteria group bacterium]|nr:DNA repair protein RadA [Patescibacteria group bacterium]